jgi:hypothetical protein
MTDLRPGLDFAIVEDGVDFNALEPSQMEEYIRRAKELFAEYFPEGGASSLDGPHRVLVAHGVQEVVFERHLVPLKARLLLDENHDLYLRKVPRSCQSVVHGRVIMDIGVWESRSLQWGSLRVQSACNGDYGNSKLEPDVGILAASDRHNTPRVIVEIEATHLSPRQSREQARIYFENHAVKAVVLIKVWPRDQNGAFAAAGILWVRDACNNIFCAEAHDFGTRPIATVARTNLSEMIGEHDRTPRVPLETMDFTEPQPHRAIGGRTPQILRVPVGLIVANAFSRDGDILTDRTPPPEDLPLDLALYAQIAEDWLDLADGPAGGAVDGAVADE